MGELHRRRKPPHLDLEVAHPGGKPLFEPPLKKAHFQWDAYEGNEIADDDLYLGRTRVVRDRVWIGLEVAGVAVCLVALYICIFHFTWFHFHLCRLYAHMGHPEAQHQVGQRLLHGVGVDKDEEFAMEWFHKAAMQGHPESSYNLAVGHLTGMKTRLEVGDARDLIKHAADHGLIEAIDTFEHMCKMGKCN